MAKNDRDKNNAAVTAERNTSNTQYNSFLDTANKNLQTATDTGNKQNEFMTQGYQDIYSRGGIDPTVAANLRALNRTNSSAYTSQPASSSSGSSSDSGGGSGGGGGVATPAVPADPFATSRSAYQNFINTGGVDMGAMKEALGGYRDLATTGGYSAEDTSRIKSGIGRLEDIGKTGGYDPATIDRVNSNIDVLSGIGKTGGFSPEALGLVKGDIAGLRSIGQTGGVDATGINRIRGNGIFDNFANTGGYSDADISNIRARATSPIAAQFATDQAAIDNSNRLQGRAGPNFAAATARLNRNRGISAADAARNAEIDIQQSIRDNKLKGATELSGAEQGLQELLTKNKLTGLSSSAEGEANLADAIAKNQLAGAGQASTQLQNLQNSITQAKLDGNKEAVAALTNLANSIAGNKLTALGGITSTQQGAEEIAQKGKIAGASGMFDVEGATEAARQQAAAIAASEAASRYATDAISAQDRAYDERWWAEQGANNEKYIGSTGLEGQLSALGGLNNVYGTANAGQGQNYQAILDAMGGRSGAAQNSLGMQIQNQGPSVMDRVMQGISIAAPVAASFMGGGMPVSTAKNVSAGTPNNTFINPNMLGGSSYNPFRR